jgi:hypothetical protein
MHVTVDIYAFSSQSVFMGFIPSSLLTLCEYWLLPWFSFRASPMWGISTTPKSRTRGLESPLRLALTL